MSCDKHSPGLVGRAGLSRLVQISKVTPSVQLGCLKTQKENRDAELAFCVVAGDILQCAPPNTSAGGLQGRDMS